MFLSGARQIDPQVGNLWLRPLLFLLLLLVLAVAGLYSLYVKSGATFGSAGLFDYFGLFMWGISADVAQKTLQGIQWQK